MEREGAADGLTELFAPRPSGSRARGMPVQPAQFCSSFRSSQASSSWDGATLI